MTSVNLGRVRPIYRGAYSDTFAYTPLDFFSYNNTTYFCIKAAKGVQPTDTGYFFPVVDASAFLRAAQLTNLVLQDFVSFTKDQTLTADQKASVAAKLGLSVPDVYPKSAFKTDGSANAPVLYGPNGELISSKTIINGPAAGQQWLEFAAAGVDRWIVYRDGDDSFNIWSHDLGTALRISSATNVADFIKMPTVAGAPLSALFGGAKPKAWRSFANSANYTPTPGTKYVLIICQGAGGGGGGQYSSPGGGGASGGTSYSLVAVSEGATYPVVVGAGGYNGSSRNNGGTGGSSYVTIDSVNYGASGGTGGYYNGSSQAPPGGPFDTSFLGFTGGWGATNAANGSTAGAGQPYSVRGYYYGQGGNGQNGGSSAYGANGRVEILEFGA